jgi:hypothetical protein
MNRVALTVLALLTIAGTAAAGVNLHADIYLPTGESHSADAYADETGNAGASVDGQPVGAPASPVPLPATPPAPGLPATPDLPAAPVPTPAAPGVPSIPPALPEAPALPGAPEIPSAPAPGAPEIPSAPGVPSIPPSTPEVPTLPETPVVPIAPPVVPMPAPEDSVDDILETVTLLAENVQDALPL